MYLGNRVAEAKKISKFSNDRTYKISPNFNRVSKSNLTKFTSPFSIRRFRKIVSNRNERFFFDIILNIRQKVLIFSRSFQDPSHPSHDKCSTDDGDDPSP